MTRKNEEENLSSWSKSYTLIITTLYLLENNLLVANGCIRSKTILMILLNDIRLDLWPRNLYSKKALTTMKLLSWLPNLWQFDACLSLLLMWGLTPFPRYLEGSWTGSHFWQLSIIYGTFWPSSAWLILGHGSTLGHWRRALWFMRLMEATKTQFLLNSITFGNLRERQKRILSPLVLVQVLRTILNLCTKGQIKFFSSTLQGSPRRSQLMLILIHLLVQIGRQISYFIVNSCN